MLKYNNIEMDFREIGCRKMLGISYVAAQLAASQEGLSSMELVNVILSLYLFMVQ
jgi:hypothetical protein